MQLKDIIRDLKNEGDAKLGTPVKTKCYRSANDEFAFALTISEYDKLRTLIAESINNGCITQYFAVNYDDETYVVTRKRGPSAKLIGKLPWKEECILLSIYNFNADTPKNTIVEDILHCPDRDHENFTLKSLNVEIA